jgi:tetratricopeptide (TPR) repeat protein
MKIILIIALFLVLFTGFNAKAQHKINPIARRLNDSAVNLGIRGGDDQLLKAIDLLSQSIKIDSNYLLPYWTKMNFQNELKQYHEAIITGCQLTKILPKDIIIKITLGEIYDRAGDTINSKNIYNNALLILNGQLDTMSKGNVQYRQSLENKAFLLILLDQPENGHKILNELYNSETDERKKAWLKVNLDWNKHDIIYGKETTTITY